MSLRTAIMQTGKKNLSRCTSQPVACQPLEKNTYMPAETIRPRKNSRLARPLARQESPPPVQFLAAADPER